MNIEFNNVRAMVEGILEHPERHEWSLQGLGMLRLHLAPNLRLHIWDHRYAAPGASQIHDHLQWGLKSTILNGVLKNERYSFKELSANYDEKPTHHWVTLKPGYGCHFKHDPRDCVLTLEKEEWRTQGTAYEQAPDEVHWSKPQGFGCVTLMEKSPTTDGDSARVFWPHGEQWGSAEPRLAEAHEVRDICELALAQWERDSITTRYAKRK